MSDIVTMVETELAETGGPVFWPAQQVYDAINEVIVETLPLAYYPTGTASITFTAGADLVPLLTNTLMWPRWLEDGERQYWIVKHADLERWDRNWRNATPEQPKFFVLWDESHLRPYALPDKTYTYILYGPTWPNEISATNTDIDLTIPPLLRMAIAMRAAARLFDYSRPDLAQAHDTEADEYEAKYRTQWRNNQSDNIRRLLPGTAFTHSQAGNIRIAKRIDGNPQNPYR